ncbi:MAG: hypothetical protein DRQ47_00670 [Gammaproteobacteria bacterium]|nr:MAG: hypothetical protein DRQ47_00670 [Gammaproteobacteria bacterium]
MATVTTTAISEFQIRDYRQSEFEELFSSLPDVTAIEVNGAYKGRLYALMGVEKLPRIICRTIMWIINNPLGVWAGKGFYETVGANVWFTVKKKIRLGYYNISIKESHDQTGQIMHLDYDIDKNMKILRPIYGEAKPINPDYYLCRMMYRTAKKDHCVMYFTLKTPDDQ